MTFALQAMAGLESCTFDIPQAFITTPVPDDEVIHILLDKHTTQLWLKFRPQDASYVSKDVLIIRLRKYLYGLRQSPQRFGARLREFFVDVMKYEVNPVDDRFFFKIDPVTKQMILVPNHVDDCYVASTVDSQLADELEQSLIAYFGGATRDDGHNFLGLHIEHDRAGQAIYLDMKAYLQSTFHKFADVLQNLYLYKYPGTLTMFRDAPPGELKIDAHRFKSLLMSLAFPGRFVFPIILPCLSVLARVQEPTLTHMHQLRHIAGYVLANIDDKIKICPMSSDIGASIDAAFNVYEDGSSQAGMVLTMGMAPIGFYTNKLKEIATSSTHAELLAVYKGTTLVCWARDFMNALGFKQRWPASISQDNRSNLFMAGAEPCTFKHSRHLLCKYSWLRQLTSRDVISFDHVPSDVISSDVLSKSVFDKSFADKKLRLNGYLPTV
jgi:hypothetical protein